jgi:DNA processing protein
LPSISSPPPGWGGRGRAGAEEDLRDLIGLTMVPGVGPQTCRALLEHFGSAGRVLGASVEKLKGVDGVGPKLAEKIRSARAEFDPLAELEECRKFNTRPVPRDSAEYPPNLNEIPDPPSLLYVRGIIEEADGLAVAIVGSRHCTPYGLRIAEKLAASLARVGLTVISGLARGIDAAAHRGALRAGGRTIAVLANGLSEIYPPEHEGLAREVEAAGALVSESPMRQAPLAGLFPQRNRVISGMSLGVVIVEATPKSGSLSTARHAMEQNREVFAVPGPVDSLASVGCHRLIRDGAKLVETVDDILEELGPLVRDLKPKPEEAAVRRPSELTLSEQERSILARLGDTAIAVDQLITETGLGASRVMATLSVLEMRRLIRRLPGQMFVRV